ncbi:MAG: DUF4230 domain-containing protein [Butyrivibrio sp.]|nr:DUF4230 domain-containing protein [Butyrivibrio sp.]
MKITEKQKNIAYICVITLSLIIAIIMLTGYMRRQAALAGAQEENPKTAVTIEEKEKKDKVLITVSTETIQEHLEDMGFLVTQEYYFTQVEHYTKEKQILKVIPTEAGFVYSYDGKVTAGVDFEKIEVQQDDDKKEITVKLPDSEIYSVEIDNDSFQVYTEKDYLWNRVRLEDFNISQSEFKAAAKLKAIDGGILKRSDEQAKTLVTNFIENLPSVKGYRIKFTKD